MTELSSPDSETIVVGPLEPPILLVRTFGLLDAINLAYRPIIPALTRPPE